MKDIEFGIVEQPVSTASAPVRSVKEACIARWLLKAGHPIVDIKQDRRDKTRSRTVFYFEADESFCEDYADFQNKFAELKGKGDTVG